MQATDGNNTIQALHNQAYDTQPNTTSLSHNQAYGTQPEEASNNSNTDMEYEVIPPLMHEKTMQNNTKDKDDGNDPIVLTSQSTTQPHQQVSPGQPGEAVEGSHMQALTENGDQEGLNDNGNVYHVHEPKAEGEIEDTAIPYEVPVPTLMKTKAK